MARKVADAYYRSPEWRAIKTAVRIRSGGMCEVQGCTSPAVVCDHIVSRRKGGRNHPDQCRDLCRLHDNQVKEARSGERRSGGQFKVIGCDINGTPADPMHPWHRP